MVGMERLRQQRWGGELVRSAVRVPSAILTGGLGGLGLGFGLGSKLVSRVRVRIRFPNAKNA